MTVRATLVLPIPLDGGEYLAQLVVPADLRAAEAAKLCQVLHSLVIPIAPAGGQAMAHIATVLASPFWSVHARPESRPEPQAVDSQEESGSLAGKGVGATPLSVDPPTEDDPP